MASEAQANPSTAQTQAVVHDGQRYTAVKEGLAQILVPEAAKDDSKGSKTSEGVQQVFYNPIQQFNRDLTVLVIKAYGKERAEAREVLHRKVRNRVAERKRKRVEQGLPETRYSKAPKTATDPAELESQPQSAEAAAPESEAVPNTATETTDQVDSGQPENDAAATKETDDQDKERWLTPRNFTILDALSATGLRALRYAHEIPFVASVTSNDLLSSAVESIRRNVAHNKLEDKIKVTHDNAISHMYSVVAESLRLGNRPRQPPAKNLKYDVVDLDPYGTAAPFLDAAVQAVKDDGGLLCVTCTDAAVWASNGYPEKAYSLYGGVPMKGGMHSHEGGLRLILHAIESSAAKYGLAMEPLVSLSIDFYARVFVRIKNSPANVKFQAGKNMVVYNCDNGCGTWTTQLLARNKEIQGKRGQGRYKHIFAQAPSAGQRCEHCSSVMHLSGPMYAGRLHNPEFIKRVLAEVKDASPDVYGTLERARGMLQTAMEEYLPTEEEVEARARKAAKRDQQLANPGDDPLIEPASGVPLSTPSTEAEIAAIEPYPFFFIPTNLASSIHCNTPSEAAIRGALIGLGYRVTRSHCKPGSIKTDAPWSVIWRIMREWIRQKAPVKVENVKVDGPAYRLLGLGKDGDSEMPDQGSEPEVVFDEKLGRDPTKGLYVRYQTNPREHWGPMNRARGH